MLGYAWQALLMGAGHKRNKFVPMAAIETSAAAAFVQHAVQKQLKFVDLSWYQVTQINCKPFFATRINIRTRVYTRFDHSCKKFCPYAPL